MPDLANIVMIDCHDLGRHLGCYGRHTVVSPNLDALAQRGILFEKSFCTAPQCSPSRAALYTGRYPHANGMMGLAHNPFSWRMHDDEIHLARYLQDVGYITTLVGGQHVTGRTEADVKNLGFHGFVPGGKAKEAGPNAQRFIQEYRDDAPFFLNVGFDEPHRNEKHQYNVEQPETSKGAAVPPYLPDIPTAHKEFAELQGMIRDMDAAVGLIVQALAANNLMENTWLIFTTDHGLAMPRAKCTLYDAGNETALIMYWPGGGLAGGKRFNEMVSHVDLVPTLLEALGLPVPEKLHGRSYWSLLQGGSYQPRDHVFMEKTFHTAYEPMRGIRTARYKLIVNLEVDIAINVPTDIQHSPIYPAMMDDITRHRPHIELYDLESDPLEKHNLAGLPRAAETERDLKQALLKWMRETDDPILQGPVASPYYAKALEMLKGDF
jgi:N-sulfoglucosamine sulfohydrolase